jgi:signal transduction histidine kinase
MNLLHLSERSADLEEIKQFLELAQREVRRVAVIANQTLQFHGRSSIPEPVRSEEAVNGSLALYQGRLLNAQIRVEQRHRATRSALCIGGEIRQVLNNLIGNAIDTGVGMSRETRQRAFEPFFSTKGQAGTGLGLWICSQLVAQNRGTLRVRSRTGSGRTGTVFMLFLPDASPSGDGASPMVHQNAMQPELPAQRVH